MRESPVEEIITDLKKFRIDVYGYDPLLPGFVIEKFGAVPLPELDKRVDAVIIAVGHKEFCMMSVQAIRDMMDTRPVLIDVKGIVDREEAIRAGIYYYTH